MKHWLKWTSIALIAVVAATTFGASAVRAQDSTATPTPAPTASGTGQPGQVSQAQQARAAFVRVIAGAILDAAAKDLNVDKVSLLKDIAAGKTMAEIVTAHNGSVAQIITDAKPAIQDAINKGVSSGKIPQTLADTINKSLDKLLNRLMNAKFPLSTDRQQNQVLAAGLGILLEATAKASNMTQRDLLAEIHAGKTLAQIAQEHNADVNQIVSSAVATATDRVNKLVTAGKLTQDQANVLTAIMPTAFNKLMNMPDPLSLRHNQTPGSGAGNGASTNPSTPVPSPVANGTPSL